jgi:hypothetical protein
LDKQYRAASHNTPGSWVNRGSAGASTGNEKMTFKYKRLRIIVQVTIAINMLCLAACNSGNKSSNSPRDIIEATGELTFCVAYHGHSEDKRMHAATIDCAGEGVATVEAVVYNSVGNLIAEGGPWDCNSGRGIIRSVPAGIGHTIVILGKNSNDLAIFHGQKSNIQIDVGDENDAGSIACYPFVPKPQSPADGSFVNPDAMEFTWSDVTGAIEYNIIVSKNGSLNDALIDASATAVHYRPSGLSDATTYYWQVRASDPYNNKGVGSQIWSFVTDTDYSNNPPIADAGPDKSVTIGETVYLDGSNSYDSDGDTLLYNWSFKSIPEGSVAHLTNEDTTAPNFLPDKTGKYVITLVANDGTINSGPSNVTITAENDLPHVTINHPTDGMAFQIKRQVALSGTATDFQDGEINGNNLSWASNLDGHLGDGNQITIDDLSMGTHTITMTAIDSSGLSNHDSITIHIEYQKIPDTGQKDSFIDIHGEDADYEINPLSFDVTDDGLTVTDNVTRLMWQREGTETPLNWAGAVSYCDVSTLAGYNNWRLPTRKEILNIKNYGLAQTSTFDPAYFSNVRDTYWTQTRYTDLHPSEVWAVRNTGECSSRARTERLDAICVRCIQ